MADSVVRTAVRQAHRLTDPTKLDIEHDRDVDLADYLLFQRYYTGAK
jgi:hypothetical protein